MGVCQLWPTRRGRDWVCAGGLSTYDPVVARLTAIIPAGNRPPTLDLCRRAIESAARAPEEVLVIDAPPAAGPAALRNQGARRAMGEVLVFVDADVEVHPDAFTRIRDAFERDPQLTAVLGSYDDRPPGGGTVARFRNLLHHHVHQAAAGPATTFWAGLGAIRRDAFLASGGFDPARFGRPSIEDVELGARLAAGGARIVLDGGLLGTHHKAWTLRTMVRTDLMDRGVPWVAMLLRARRGSNMLNLGWRHRLSALASLAIVWGAGARRARPAVAGLCVLITLNRSFYALLWRRGGPRGAVAGVGLHVLHHLTGIAAVGLGMAVHLRERLGARR
jgi:hypothetical protein